ncbi:nematoblast specific protein (macronuclear) [Tetrahymena thermophila SB210]|uniref:Nematoblast specific protein n=1 Tax=Tetrahymena thermophila (strain SB210) TaxID=312017 RepID=Q22FX1_TETTS|nr:nematoblast specific protein [Tetrahymena thermophila SB210]EAR84255.1 nematoblast specific protein [Tetrahymena thermophila SB210]|eukprot:XP_001031918.1 nematoblast specific protein [Tetrahymena thermophila SB210]
MTDIQIPFGWNAYQSCSAVSCSYSYIQEQGVSYWSDSNIIISLFFYVAVAGAYDMSLLSDEVQREAEVLVSIPSIQYNYYARFNPDSLYLSIGSIQVKSPGYVHVYFKGTNSLVNRKAGDYPKLKSLVLSKVENVNAIQYVNEDFSSYFGRRGPSVHLNYQLESNYKIQQFYNEVTIPRFWDAVGTYAMAIGFSYGYFGMQVNSDSERRILFSVWSPQETDDPSQVLQENTVLLVSKGKNTVINSFGNEGSGGQSYLVYPWVAGVAYKFKLEGKPSSNGYSIFSAYFNDPTKSEDYILIASWKRPKTQSYLNNLHSFLENFSPENGHISRKAYFNNQKAINYQSKEIKVLSASFSYDETANQKQRLDYDGGVDDINGYYLRNCGFFNKTSVQYGDQFIKNKL